MVRGRLWRCTNPKLSAKQKEKLVKELMTARRTKDRAGVDKAKRALGERGPTWWKGPEYNRDLAKNPPTQRGSRLLNSGKAWTPRKT